MRVPRQAWAAERRHVSGVLVMIGNCVSQEGRNRFGLLPGY